MKDEEFIEVVRRHRPNALVPLIAKIASQRIDPDTWFRPRQRGFGVPWALAEITRTSIAYSNEYRGDASERDVARCSDAYSDLDDPELVEGYQGPLAGFFFRLCAQLEYQLPMLNEMARSIAIFGHTESVRQTRVIRPGWDEELLGSDLVTFVAAGQMLQIAARSNEGRFNPRWMEQRNFSFIREVTDPDALRAAWSRAYLIDARDFAAVNGRPAASPWRRFAHNPLLSRPIVSGLHNDWLIPVPGLVVRRLSPLGLYYAGIDHFGKVFADDLGYLFEPYIGAQLRLLEAANVEPGFTYGPDNRETVDFIVTLPEVVVLAEVKSVRPTAPVRAGNEGAESELRRMLNKGVDQIELADRLIEERHPAFSHVATDRPRIGLVITLEDFHVLNSGFHRSILERQRPDLPIGIASAGHIEHWVTVTDKTPGTVALEAVFEPVTELGDTSRGVALKQALEGCRHRRNELIDAAWASGPWEQLRASED